MYNDDRNVAFSPGRVGFLRDWATGRKNEMFNDERERQLFELRSSSPSIQAWAARLDEEAMRDRKSPWARVLWTLGSGLIAFGSKLMERFGSSGKQPRDHVFSH